MKKLIILLIAAFIVTGLSAQNNKRTSAFNYFKNGKLDKAKEFIDPTITHPKTMNVAKTWYYRGNIYLQIALDTNYQYLDPNALNVAYEAYKKCLELDSRGEFKTDINQNFRIIASNFYNQGLASFDEEDYLGAAQHFLNTYQVTLEVGVLDTLSLSNVGLAYIYAEEYEKALETYLQLIEIGFKDPHIYKTVSEIYLNQKSDTVTAEQYIIQGREIFPDNYQLLIAETNFFLTKGENEKVINNLIKALETDSLNADIWVILGANYENTGDPERAAEAYQKCIDIDSAYADAYYNLGAMYNNQAVDIIEIATELPQDAIEEYNIEKAKADELFQKALPYLEKSDELNPDNLEILQTLKQIYTRLNDMDKLQEVNERIKSLVQ